MNVFSLIQRKSQKGYRPLALLFNQAEPYSIRTWVSIKLGPFDTGFTTLNNDVHF